MSESFSERTFSIGVLAVTAAVGWSTLDSAAPIQPAALIETFEHRVEKMAQAIAAAEGYFAPGMHDGRSLPYRLNNPGALKKPALGARDLPTWKDTGLVQFPNAEHGWTALRHQVRLMLCGASRIYDPQDSLLGVGRKYADGDSNWGRNVAATLGVSPALTLGELSPVLDPQPPSPRQE